MMCVRQLRWFIVVGLILVSCAGTGTDGDPDQVGTDGSTEGLKIAYGSDLDPNDVADQFGVRAAGGEVTPLNDDTQAFAGLTRGNFDVANVGFIETIRAAQAGVPLRIFYVAQRKFEFVSVSQADIETFSELAGKTVANYSENAIEAKVLLRDPVAEVDPSLVDQVQWIVMPESPNRAAAMLAGRIDATTLEFSDYLRLTQEGDFNLLSTMRDVAGPGSKAISTVWVTSEDFYETNRATLEAFAEELQQGYDKFYSDKDAWLELAATVVPGGFSDKILSQTYAFYRRSEMYPKKGDSALTREVFRATDEFDLEAGEYEESANPQIVDFQLIESVASD